MRVTRLVPDNTRMVSGHWHMLVEQIPGGTEAIRTCMIPKCEGKCELRRMQAQIACS